MHRAGRAGIEPGGVGAAVLKIAVYGAGAIGGHIAARLARKGVDVSVIARGAQLGAIRARGLTIRATDATFNVAVRAGSPAELGVQDAVLVTVKAPALAAVAEGIGPLLGPDTLVAFVQNGIPWWYLGEEPIALADPGDAVRRAVGLQRTVGGVVYSSCTVVEPGVIVVGNARSRLWLGRPDDARPEALVALTEALEQPGYECKIPPSIRDAVWAKLLANLSSGHIAVLTAAAPLDAYKDTVIQQATRAVFAECLAVAQALGCAPAHDLEAMMGSLQKMEHRPSILQDLTLGRPMEIDGIFGTAQFLARREGVATPLLDMLVALMKVCARAAGLYTGSAV